MRFEPGLDGVALERRDAADPVALIECALEQADSPQIRIAEAARAAGRARGYDGPIPPLPRTKRMLADARGLYGLGHREALRLGGLGSFAVARHLAPGRPLGAGRRGDTLLPMTLASMIPAAQAVDPALLPPGSLGPSTEFVLLYDGDCPLCEREVGLMRWLNRAGRLGLVDIASPGFVAASLGLDHDALMGEIHGIERDGRIVRGFEVFRLAYRAVGLGWLLAPTRLPGVGWLFEEAYSFFARHRLWLTGRADECPTSRRRTAGDQTS